MASEKQLVANPANSRKSNGPRTEAGKARSRLNSRKHGLTAKMLIIVGEEADDFDQLRAELMDQYDQQSALECELVERLTGILWRLRRVPFFEAAIINARQEQVAEERREQQQLGLRPGKQDDAEKASDDTEGDAARLAWMGDALTQDAAFGDGLGKLAQREAHLTRELNKTLEALTELRESRTKTERRPLMLEAVPLPSAA